MVLLPSDNNIFKEVDETVVDGVLKKTKKGKKKAAHTTNVPSTTNATVWHTSVPVQVGPSVTNLDKVLSISPPFGQVHSPIVQPPICQYSPPFLNTATNTEFMVPNVEWRSKISPYKNIPYRGCVIFDTCSLIKEPSILEEVMNRKSCHLSSSSHPSHFRASPRRYSVHHALRSRWFE